LTVVFLRIVLNSPLDATSLVELLAGLLAGMQTTAPEALDAKSLAALLSIGVSTVYQLDSTGMLPAGVLLGDRRCKRWIRGEIVAWLQAGAPSRARWDLLKQTKRTA
jgi:predicted DNA-binding transcriptional regulator AlpA